MYVGSCEGLYYHHDTCALSVEALIVCTWCVLLCIFVREVVQASLFWRYKRGDFLVSYNARYIVYVAALEAQSVVTCEVVTVWLCSYRRLINIYLEPNKLTWG